jgi:hypothetical protein
MMKLQLGRFLFSILGLTIAMTSVSAAQSVPQPPSYAKLISSIEDRTTWGHCSDCAADPSKSNPPTASWTFQKYQSSPSLSGSSTKMGIHGSEPYANVLHWTKFGNQSQYRNFIWEFYIFGKSDMNNAQNLEFDLWQSRSGRKYMFGTQCNYWKKIWQGWNEVYNHWVDLPISCPKFPTGVWTRVRWYFQRTTDGKTRYISVTVGNTTHTVNRYFPSKSTSWGESLGVQFQQDLNKYAADYTIWVDKVKLWMW